MSLKRSLIGKGSELSLLEKVYFRWLSLVAGRWMRVILAVLAAIDLLIGRRFHRAQAGPTALVDR